MTNHETFLLAVQRHQAGNLPEAEQLYRQVIAREADHGDALYLLGTIVLQSGQRVKAAELIQKAIAFKPGVAQYHLNLAIALGGLGQAATAMAHCKRALDLRPDYVEALITLGNVQADSRDHAAAAAAFEKAIRLRPEFAEAYYNLGNALDKLGKWDEAIAAYQRAVSLRPGYLEAFNNLGACFKHRGSFAEAAAVLGHVLGMRPDYPGAHWNMALLLLLQGDYARGWEEYEWRWRVPGLILPAFSHPQPLWDGSELSGRTILLHAEQGLGDTIQFARYAPQVAQRGGRVVLAVQDELVSFLSGAAGVEMVVPRDRPLPRFEVHCPLLSLPRIAGTRLDNIPAQARYLSGEVGRVARWKTRVPSDGRRKIGLAWAGKVGYSQDRQRSFALSTLAPLAPAPNAWFCSLQKGEAAKQAQNPGAMQLTDWTAELSDVAETAALIENLDMVICADTLIAHLAAALGKPAWVLLPAVPDWRWMLHRLDSPWYPSVRLFRQKQSGDWGAPVDEVAEALRIL